jgi:hypothetical protein
MRLFGCQNCGQTIFFENSTCNNCGYALGYHSETKQFLALNHEGDPVAAATVQGQKFRYCANAPHGACNWLLPQDSAEIFCAACRCNRTIPDLTQGNNLRRWQCMETAKHRLFYTIIALCLPLKNREDDPQYGLAFDFLADAPSNTRKIFTGHDAGLITINLSEADDVEREKQRAEMGEPYRTLLGHFRHEAGHYFWNILVHGGGRLEDCRSLFGDDSQNYTAALQRHYSKGAPADWQNSFVSAYATAHPWEDFAETWAHYMHIVDTLETASAFGLRIHPVTTTKRMLNADIDFDPHRAADIRKIMDAWVPLTFAMNSLNRSMGQADPYPFTLSPSVIEKLQFIHEIIHANSTARLR